MKFRLECTDDSEGSTIIVQFVARDIASVLDWTETFIKAARLPVDGYLNIFRDDDPSQPTVSREEQGQ